MRGPEMVKIDDRRRFICPCGTRNQSMFLKCDKYGISTIDGLLLRCWTCGRIITADAVVIGRVEVTA
jgi:hypothetical protein